MLKKEEKREPNWWLLLILFNYYYNIITIMFIKLGFNFSKFANKDQDKYEYLQEIIYIIQQCIYSNKGSLNKFLMDDKGSVVLLAWGLPPFSSENIPSLLYYNCT